MSSTAVAVSETGSLPPTKPTLRHRFRKSWRAVLFFALIPFFQDTLIPGVPPEFVRFLSGMVVLVPLATFIEVVTEDLIERLGQLVGGLLHAFFGNVAFFALTVTTLITAANSTDQQAELISVVQSSIAGTIVVDILFILGIAIFIGGMRNGRMQFNAEYSNQYAEMITVAVIALALPSLAYKLQITVGLKTDVFSINQSEAGTLSDITAAILIIAYIGYLGWTVFRFRDMPAKPENPEDASDSLSGALIGPLAQRIASVEEAEQRAQLSREALASAPTLKRDDPVTPDAPPSALNQINSARLERRPRSAPATNRSGEGIAFWEIMILILGTAGVVYISENMARSIEGTLSSNSFLGLNPFFIGFIILPVSSNLVEFSAAISAAWHDRMETCLAITAGSAIQVALLVAPLLVIVGHIVGLADMNLIFGVFILAIFGLIAYLFQLITVDGETSWLEGLQFSSFFAVIAVVAYFAGK